MTERSGPTGVQDRPQNISRSRHEISPAAAGNLIELTGYQEASIVSRVLVERDTGNVTLFAFDQGQELREHTAPFDAFVQVLEGTAEITISGKPFKLVAGEVILMPANQPHAVRAISRFQDAAHNDSVVRDHASSNRQ